MELGTILCPIDFSTLAERELDLAIAIGEPFGARLVLHHNVSAISPGFSKAWEWDEAHQLDGPSTDEAQKRLEALLRRLPAGVRGEAVITHGPLVTVVLALAQTLPADLLVLGTRGWSTEDHASVTERILAQTRCPVLTIGDATGLQRFRLKPNRDGEMPCVVVPTDLSESARSAVDYAIELARVLPLRLRLLHVSQGASQEPMKTLGRMVPDDLRRRAKCHLRRGKVEEKIKEFLHQTKPSLVVMGTHARSFWRRLFTRDVARRLLHGATYPVCFVPPTVGRGARRPEA